MELVSTVKNPHDVGIDDTSLKDPREEPTNKLNGNKFRFFATNTPKMLLEGIEVTLKMSYDLKQCKQKLMENLQIEDKDNKDLLIYISGGIPFIEGTLNDYYTILKNLKKFIYGIVIYKFTDKDLNGTRTELCSIQTKLEKRLLAPFFNPELINDDWTIGLCNMACLLGYLSHYGPKSDKLLRASASVIRFPPLLTCLNRVIDRNYVTNRDIITISATFHTYFKFLLSGEEENIFGEEQVFEYSLRCCNMITHITRIPDQPIRVIDSGPLKDALVKLKQPEKVYMFNADASTVLKFSDIKKFKPRAIEDANKSFISFSPIAPLSTRLVNTCSIVRGREHTFLYLSQSMEKGAGTINNIDLIDPIEGPMANTDLDEFARQQGNGSADDVSMLIDPDKIKQLVFVCFDKSSSMNLTIDGDKFSSEGYESTPRTVVAIQFLTSFANKIYAYRIPCLLGLLVFSDEIDVRCELSPLIPDFEMIGLKEVEACGMTSLWEAIKTASDSLNNYKFMKDINQKKIIKRIIVISDGEDTTSKTETLESVAKNLLDNKIILDAVFASSTFCCNQLATLSHITGGVSIQPKDANEGMSLFEQSAFLNIDERDKGKEEPIIPGDKSTIPSNLKSKKIDEKFIRKAVENVYYDQEVKRIKHNDDNPRITTARYRCFMNRADNNLNTRMRRIMRELHYAALVMDKKSPKFDSDILVYPHEDNYEKWVLFMKALDYYDSKWFKLSVTFPEEYPVEPPTIRFVTVPYHLNVSKEGRICLEILEKGYISSMHVIDIVQQIKILFLLPEIETPIQIEVLDLFLTNPDEYNRKAKESAKDLKSEIKDLGVPTDKGVKFNLTYRDILDDDVPPYLRSQISGRVIKNPVLASSGIIYEKSELIQLVANGQNCVVTGKPLTEKLENFI